MSWSRYEKGAFKGAVSFWGRVLLGSWWVSCPRILAMAAVSAERFLMVVVRYSCLRGPRCGRKEWRSFRAGLVDGIAPHHKLSTARMFLFGGAMSGSWLATSDLISSPFCQMARPEAHAAGIFPDRTSFSWRVVWDHRLRRVQGQRAAPAARARTKPEDLQNCRTSDPH